MESSKPDARRPSADTQCSSKKHPQISERAYLEYLYAAHIAELTGIRSLFLSRQCRHKLAVQFTGIKSALERLNRQAP